jgi:hypothetical protein
VDRSFSHSRNEGEPSHSVVNQELRFL